MVATAGGDAIRARRWTRLRRRRRAYQKIPPSAAELGLGAVYGLSALISFALSRGAGGATLIWPGNAIAAAALIRFPRLRFSICLAMVAVGTFIADTSVGHQGAVLACALAMINALEVAAMTRACQWRLRLRIPLLEVSQATHTAVIIGLAVPALAAIPGGVLVHEAIGSPWWSATQEYWRSHALGVCIFGPAILLFDPETLRSLVSRRRAGGNAALTAVSLISGFAAVRYLQFPFVIMSVPLLAAAFRLGGFGASVLSLLAGLEVTALWLLHVRPSGPALAAHAAAASHLPVLSLIAMLMPAVAVGIGSDERACKMRALRLSERRFRESLARSPIGAVIVDLNGRWSETNAAVQAMLGYAAAELHALSYLELTHPDDHQDITRGWEALRSGALDSYEAVRRLRHKSGSWVFARAAVSLVRDEDGRPLHYIAQLESLEARRAAERALAQEQQLLKTTLRAIGNGVITTDAGGRITYMNVAGRDMLGQALTDVQSRPFDEIVAFADAGSLRPLPELLGQCLTFGNVVRHGAVSVLHRPDGTALYVSVSISPLFDAANAVAGAVIVLQDATEQYAREQELARQARQDALTGLINRLEYQRRAKRAFQRARTQGESAAVIAIDLDRFKDVNDTGGHAAGDAVLSQVAVKLQALVRGSDTVARLGGDEFAIVLERCSPERLSGLAERILAALNPLEVSFCGATYCVGASVGAALVTPEMQDEAAWLRAADQACYSAKRAGRGALRTAANCHH